MTVDPTRLYLWSGVIWYGALRAYWVSLVVRLTIALELPSLQLVLLGTAMETALLVSEVPTGVVADRFSRKWSIVIGFVGVGLAQIAAGIADTFGLLVATQVVWGVAYTFRSGADTAWITDELGGADAVEGLIIRLGRLRQLTAVVSIGAGAALARLTSLTTAVVVTGLLLVATGAVLAVVMPERGFARRARRPGSAGAERTVGEGEAPGLWSTLAAGARVTIGSPSLRLLLVVLVLAGLASEAIDRLDIRRLGDLGLADYDEVVLVAVIAVSESLVGAVVLWWAERRIGPGRTPTALGVTLLVAAVGIAALGLVAVLPVAAAGLILQGGVRQAAAPFTTAWANAHAPSETRATVLSFVEQANSVGEIGGGVALGLVAAATTVPTAMTVSLVLIVLAAGVALRAQPTMSAERPLGAVR
ncbi:MAG: MFS transporter [Actinomycetota bacterium]